MGNQMGNQMGALGDIPPGFYGMMLRGDLKVKGNLMNFMGIPGLWRYIGVIAQNAFVGGTLTNVFGWQGESERQKESASDAPAHIFKTSTASEGGCYELENSSCALIINNIFNGPNSETGYTENHREGAEVDNQKLGSLFCHLKFSDIQMEENVTSVELGVILENFRSHVKKKGYSSCFIIIMSHGGSGANSIVMDNLEEVDLYKDIVYKFSDHDDVREVPKVFLVQACRNSEGPPVGSGIEKPAKLRDLLVGHSTSPHLPAARNTKTGAVYIDIIDKVFRKSAQTLSLASLLYEVYTHDSMKKRQQYPPVELFGFRDYRFKL